MADPSLLKLPVFVHGRLRIDFEGKLRPQGISRALILAFSQKEKGSPLSWERVGVEGKLPVLQRILIQNQTHT
jgi:hypothetical protein